VESVVPSDDNGVQIIFEDGITGQFDAVIGADGIFSNIRKYVHGPVNADAHAASPAGFWDCRNVVPFEKAKATLGEEFFDLDRQYGWAGDGAFIMHDVLENRTLVQCVISATEKSPSVDRKHILTRESLTDTLGSWLHGPIAKGMIDVRFLLIYIYLAERCFYFSSGFISFQCVLMDNITLPFLESANRLTAYTRPA
jgi:salicylate hydroxylase